MKRWLIGLAIVVPIGVAIALKFATAYTDYGMACEFTCSHQGYRESWLGMRSKEWYRVSPIEKRLSATPLKHKWVS